MICIYQSPVLCFNVFTTIIKILLSKYQLVQDHIKNDKFEAQFNSELLFFGNILANDENYFFTREKFIGGYIATTSIYTIVTYLSFQWNYYHFSFTCDDWTIVHLVQLISRVSIIFSIQGNQILQRYLRRLLMGPPV